MTAFRALLVSELKALARSRAYAAFIAGGVFIVLLSIVVAELSLGEASTIVGGVGLAFQSVLSVTMGAAFLITGVARELETRQALCLLYRPISRTQWLAAKLTATLILVFVANVATGAFLAAFVAYFDGPFLKVLGSAAFSTFEAMIVLNLGLVLAVRTTPPVSATVVAAVFMLGRLDGNIVDLIERGTFGSLTSFARLAAQALPHLSVFDLTAVTDLNPSTLVQACAYSLIYGGGLFIVATFLLNRRNLA